MFLWAIQSAIFLYNCEARLACHVARVSTVPRTHVTSALFLLWWLQSIIDLHDRRAKLS